MMTEDNMTKKRFTKYVPDSYGYTYITTIIDTKKNKQTGNIDEIVDMLNELNNENIELHIQNDFLKDENQHMRDLVNENEQLKNFIQKLTTKGTGKIHLANGSIYKIDAILIDFKR